MDFLFINHSLFVLRYKHTERQASSGSFEVLTLGLTLGNGSWTNFGVSQCIPMEPCHCHCHLMLGVFMPLDQCSGGSKGGVTDAPPRIQILSISCSFWEILAKLYLGAPSLGKSRICHGSGSTKIGKNREIEIWIPSIAKCRTQAI